MLQREAQLVLVRLKRSGLVLQTSALVRITLNTLPHCCLCGLSVKVHFLHFLSLGSDDPDLREREPDLVGEFFKAAC